MLHKAGLAGKKNGELLQLAEPHFDVFVTLDQGFEYQQNLARKKIAVIVIRARSNRFADVHPHAAACIEAIGLYKARAACADWRSEAVRRTYMSAI